MNFLDNNGNGFGEQAVQSDYVTKPSQGCHQLATSVSPTFIISTAPTTLASSNCGSFSMSVPSVITTFRCSVSDKPNQPRFLEPQAEERGVQNALTSFNSPSEPYTTIISVEEKQLNFNTNNRVLELIPTSKHTVKSERQRIYDQRQATNPELYQDNKSTNLALTRTFSSLPVANRAVCSEKIKTASSIDSIAMRDSLIFRLQRMVATQRKPVLNYLFPLCLLVGLILLIYMFRDTAKDVLYWIETQNSWITFVIFLCMFTIISFPVTVGYLVLIIASGYLFGFVRGLLTVVIGANLGVAIAHNTIKSLQTKLPIHKYIKNETGRAILRVISGPKAFKIVIFARLTPIPFGLQNTIFGISSVNTRSYHVGTVIGLLPAQTINVYLGSKLRSIHEVLNDHNAALGLAGYGVFVVEVIVGAALMVWVIQKARLELSAALLATTDADSDEKILIEIEA